MSKQLVVFYRPERASNGGFIGKDHFDGSDTHLGLCRKIQLQLAFENNQLLQINTVTGKQRRVDYDRAVANLMVDSDGTPAATPGAPKAKFGKTKSGQAAVRELVVVPEDILSEDAHKFIDHAADYKPAEIIIKDIKWKYLVRSILRGKNIMITGDAGSGKTSIARFAAKALKRDHFYFNLGASQDPRGYLIGNTHFVKDEGTVFDQSLFVQAIQVPNAIILVDELSRAHPDAWNILMSVLDPQLRYLALDEQIGSPTIKVAEGVCFIATANIGAKYTSTKVMDRALLDRFIIMEMDLLTGEEEASLLFSKYKITREMAAAIGDIAHTTRVEMMTDAPKINSIISTRITNELAELLQDGFSLDEAANVCIYPFYDTEGGIDSERTFMKQLVQKHITE